MDHRSFREQLTFSIGFAVTRSRDLLRRILKDHTSGDARQMIAERVLQQIEQSGFEIDDVNQIMTKRPPSANHG
jgi:predicted metal-dependent phosphotriesterase family hydrolase